MYGLGLGLKYSCTTTTVCKDCRSFELALADIGATIAAVVGVKEVLYGDGRVYSEGVLFLFRISKLWSLRHYTRGMGHRPHICI